ncbi:MAG: DUF3489 domain-containing protein [Aestuariivirga sp.]
MTKPNKTKANKSKTSNPKTKAEQIVGLLACADGASIAEIMKVTGWQARTVCGDSCPDTSKNRAARFRVTRTRQAHAATGLWRQRDQLCCTATCGMGRPSRVGHCFSTR